MASSFEKMKSAFEALEQEMNRRGMIVLARMKSGETREMSVDECIENGAEFVKVVSGGNSNDMDRLMTAAFDKVFAEYQNKPEE